MKLSIEQNLQEQLGLLLECNCISEAALIQARIDGLIAAKGKPQPDFLTIKELKARWHCSDTFAREFARRKSTGATKPAKEICIPIKAVRAHESQSQFYAG